MKLALSATHCSGKTTLIQELSKLSEFKDYKLFTEKTKFLRDELGVKLNNDSELISQYIFLGERAKELFSSKNIFCDRSIYDVCSYTLSSKSIPFVDREQFVKGCAPLMQEYDIIFYVNPIGVEIEDNGLRSIDPKYRDDIDFTIRSLLDEYPPQKLVELKGPTTDRINTILSTIK